MSTHTLTALIAVTFCTALGACALAPDAGSGAAGGAPRVIEDCALAQGTQPGTLRADFEAGWGDFVAEAPRWCVLMGSEAGSVMVGAAHDGALIVQWPEAQPLKISGDDAEALRFAQAQDTNSPTLCAFPSDKGEGSVHEVPVFNTEGGQRASDAHLPIRGRLWALGPPAGGLCRTVFVSDLRYQLADRGVPMAVGIEGRVVALSRHAEAWDYFIAP